MTKIIHEPWKRSTLMTPPLKKYPRQIIQNTEKKKKKTALKMFFTALLKIVKIIKNNK